MLPWWAGFLDFEPVLAVGLLLWRTGPGSVLAVFSEFVAVALLVTKEEAGGKWWNPGRSPPGTGRRATQGAGHLQPADLGPSSPGRRRAWRARAAESRPEDAKRMRASGLAPACPFARLRKPSKAARRPGVKGPTAATRGQRGATLRVGQGVQPQPAMERAAPAARQRTGGSRKARAGRSQTVAEREASPRTPVPQWEAQPRAPSRQARETGSRRSAARPQPATRPAWRGSRFPAPGVARQSGGRKVRGALIPTAWGASSGPSARPGVQPGSRARCRFNRDSG